MTTVDERPPAGGGHPDAGTIAAHVERRLPRDEASRVDAHLAACSSCYEVFAEAARFRLEEDGEDGVAAPQPASAVVPRAHVARAAAVLALAAAVALGSWAAWRAQRRPAEPTLLAALVDAVGESRFVEPRLTGGFRYSRYVRLRAGEGRPGLDAQPAAVIAAVARIRERAEADPTPEALAALGVTYLVSGDAAAAVKALESAAAQAPRDARIQSDLAAAYLTRALRLDEPADLPRGLEAAENAVALPGAPPEAWFNRALALEALHLVDQARRAWEDYLGRDPSSPWADEARRRLVELPPARRSSVEEDRARVRDALAQGGASLERLTEEQPAIVREYFDDELLPAWAEARLTPVGDARDLAAQAAILGEALLRAPATRSHGTPRPPSARQPRPPAATRRACRPSATVSSPRRVAATRRSGRPAARSARPPASWPSAAVLRGGGRGARGRPVPLPLGPRRGARRARGPRVRRAGSGTPAAARPGALAAGADRGRAGRAHGRGRTIRSRPRGLRGARRARNEAFVHALTAEALASVGNQRRAWAERRAALSLLARVRDPRRLQGILEEAALSCLDARLGRAALALLSTLVDSGAARTSDATLCDALTRRAAVRLEVADASGAASDLAEARRRLVGIEDAAFSERMRAEVDAVEGALLATTGREGGEVPLRRAIDYFGRAAPVRVPTLRVLQARVLAARSETDAAEAELEAGIRLVESQRLSLHDVAEQAAFLDQSLPLFDDMIALQVDERRDPAAALAFLERARGRQLADALGDGFTGGGEGEPPEPAAPSDAASLQRRLPEGVGLVYYAVLGSRVLAWRLTRESVRFAPLAVSATEMSRLAAAHATALERRVSPDAVRRSSE
ncbi:MAG: hypothetical protein U0599_30575, partial [Vicinamibacteria bacterium]